MNPSATQINTSTMPPPTNQFRKVGPASPRPPLARRWSGARRPRSIAAPGVGAVSATASAPVPTDRAPGCRPLRIRSAPGDLGSRKMRESSCTAFVGLVRIGVAPCPAAGIAPASRSLRQSYSVRFVPGDDHGRMRVDRPVISTRLQSAVARVQCLHCPQGVVRISRLWPDGSSK